MNTKSLDEDYWSKRYKEGQTGWDIGYISTPLKAYIDQLSFKDIEILIPGAGNAYEAEYLLSQGFTNVTVCDISAEPLKRWIGNKKIRVIQGDFFELTGQYDLILEQTFFCAIDPTLRPAYVSKMYDLLKPGGKLTGVFFQCEFPKEGPPFGGNKAEYEILFRRKFHIKEFSDAYNSINPRLGNELFVILEKGI